MLPGLGAFWATGLLVLELVRSHQVRYQLALSLGLVLVVVGVFFGAELDTLGALVLSAYSSVFIALFLLALHFGHSQAAAPAGSQSAALAAVVAPLLGLGIAGFATFPSLQLEPWLVLWQDLPAAAGNVAHQSATLHFFFFRLFVVETLVLNLYLFIGLVAILALLLFVRTWADGAWVSSALGQARLPFSRAGLAQAPNVRLRQVGRFRRQTRRSNTTRLRSQRP